MKLSRQQASDRSKKGWKKRKRAPQYGLVQKQRGKTYWVRPNDQKIRLKGFNHHEVQRIQPAFAATDRRLKSDVKVATRSIKNKRKTGHRGYAVYQTPHLRAHGDILVNKSLFRQNAVNPAGVVGHEIGHTVFPGGGSSRSKYEDYQRAFGYKTGKGKRIQDVERYRYTKDNPINQRSHKVMIRKGKYKGLYATRTRQQVNAAEDFAETFRHMAGLPISNRRYWRNVHTDTQRMEHMYKHYFV